MVMKIKPAMNECLNLMTMKPGQRKKVEKYIRVYTKAETCSQGFIAFFYKLGNAIKHVFGKSDKQIATKALKQYLWDQMPSFMTIMTKVVPGMASKMQAPINQANSLLLKLLKKGNSRNGEAAINEVTTGVEEIKKYYSKSTEDVLAQIPEGADKEQLKKVMNNPQELEKFLKSKMGAKKPN